MAALPTTVAAAAVSVATVLAPPVPRLPPRPSSYPTESPSLLAAVPRLHRRPTLMPVLQQPSLAPAPSVAVAAREAVLEVGSAVLAMLAADAVRMGMTAVPAARRARVERQALWPKSRLALVLEPSSGCGFAVWR